MSLARQVAGMLVRGVVHLVDSALRMQEAQLEVDDDDVRDDTEVWEPYGFTAAPRDGAEGLAASVGASDHTVLLCIADRRYRLTGLQEGEVALYDDQGAYVKLSRTGIQIVAATGQTVEVTGATTINGTALATGGYKASVFGTTVAGKSGIYTDPTGQTLIFAGGILIGGTGVP